MRFIARHPEPLAEGVNALVQPEGCRCAGATRLRQLLVLTLPSLAPRDGVQVCLPTHGTDTSVAREGVGGRALRGHGPPLRDLAPGVASLRSGVAFVGGGTARPVREGAGQR